MMRAYFDVLRAQRLLQVAEGTFAARNQLLDKVTFLSKVGIKSDLILASLDVTWTSQINFKYKPK